eukprot:Nk52_evm51s266 gene=Nk52_evmTU51s266
MVSTHSSSATRGLGFNLVVAVSAHSFGIGLNNSIPWRARKDMAFFKSITSDIAKAEGENGLNGNNDTRDVENAVIMGRKTWESIPVKFRPFQNRINVVLTRNPSFSTGCGEDVLVCGSFQAAIDKLSCDFGPKSGEMSGKRLGKVFVIGGSEIYKQAMEHPLCEGIYLTKVYPAGSAEKKDFECDTFLPALDEKLFVLDYEKPLENGNKKEEVIDDSDVKIQFCYYRRRGDINL